MEILENESVSGRQLKTVLEEAVKQHPKESQLWTRLVKIHLESKGEEEEQFFQIDTGADLEELPSADEEPTMSLEIPAVFWEAVKQLGPTASSISIWETAVEHFESIQQTNSKASEVLEDLYQKAMIEEPPVGNHFKPRYLSWIAKLKGFQIPFFDLYPCFQLISILFAGRDEAYTLYEAKASLPPLVLDFHYRMANIELEQPQPDVKLVRKILEKAAIQFGQKDMGKMIKNSFLGNM